MENIWAIYMGDIYVGSCEYFVSGLMKLRPENLYLNSVLVKISNLFKNN